MKKWLNIFVILVFVAGFHLLGYAGPKCAGLACGKRGGASERRFIPDRRFISDRELIWDWSRWSRSWEESKGEFLGITGLGEGGKWAYENVAALRDAVDLLSEVSQGVVDIYHTGIFDPLTEGMGGFTPLEEAMKSQAESAAVTGTFGAAGAAGGALGAAARVIGTGLAGFAGPGLVTAPGIVVPAAVPAATFGGGAGVGTAVGTGLGAGTQATGISQAEMSMDQARSYFQKGRDLLRAAGKDPKAVKVFNPKDPSGVFARGYPGVLPALRDITAAAGGDVEAVVRLQSRRMHPLERDWAGWMAIDPATPSNPWRVVFKHDPRGNIEYRVTQHYRR